MQMQSYPSRTLVMLEMNTTHYADGILCIPNSSYVGNDTSRSAQTIPFAPNSNDVGIYICMSLHVSLNVYAETIQSIPNYSDFEMIPSRYAKAIQSIPNSRHAVNEQLPIYRETTTHSVFQRCCRLNSSRSTKQSDPPYTLEMIEICRPADNLVHRDIIIEASN